MHVHTYKMYIYCNIIIIIIIGYVTSNLDRISWHRVYNMFILYTLHACTKTRTGGRRRIMCHRLYRKSTTCPVNYVCLRIVILLRYCRRRATLRSLERTRPGAKVFGETVTVYYRNFLLSAVRK